MVSINRLASMTKILKLTNRTLPDTVDETCVKLAAELLLKGQVIAVPTDTIYGIAGLAQNSEAVNRIYQIKGRDPNKPIAICLNVIEDIHTYAQVTVSDSLLSSLLPGQVTLVFNRTQTLNKNFNPDTNLIGVRIPDNNFIRSVCGACSSPLALTSANYSASQSCLDVEEFSYLHNRLAAVFDGGRLGNTEESRLGSTVVDLSEAGTYKIIRPGSAFHVVTQAMQTFNIQERTE